MNRLIIVANWKMNGTVSETLKMITELSHRLEKQTIAEVVIAPPFTSLYSAQIVLQETSFKLAAQNCHWEHEGAYTGEVSPDFLREIGCSHVIVGHSERRRYFGETDEMVGRKIQTALASELTPIFCIGETKEERSSGRTEAVLEQQIKKGLQGLPMGDIKDLIIAYEPVWAIGTGETAAQEQIEKEHSYIRNLVARAYDAPTANRIPLLYGGSVNSDNIKKIVETRNVDGVLVGGASLSLEKFVKMIRLAESREVH
ncbi:MAG: triose-phosphate isomerase [Deltaproteobacteria bacterium]|nr:triose-phosphate isomerase [Deltaproteobacteria bacterium]